jgi:hypothetical protein
VVATRTAPGGWHSHGIDLADHGGRDTNYLEMCQLPAWAYWMTQRFVPGALNRWRASEHVACVAAQGLPVQLCEADMRERLPLPQHRLSSRFRALDKTNLRTTGLDVVLRKVACTSG